MGCCGSRPLRRDLIYSVEVGPELPGGTKELRNPKHTGGYLTLKVHGLNTLNDLCMNSFKNFSSRPCLGTRVGESYKWKTYQEVKELAEAFGSGLTEMDLCPQEEHDGYNIKFLSVYSKTREEWLLADLSCILYGITIVPLYDTLGATSTEFILTQTNLRCILLSDDKLEIILQLKSDGCTGNLEHVIVMGDVSDEIRGRFRVHGLTITTFYDVIEYGKLHKLAPIPATPDSVFTITYTSGTTGNPKGVITTHENMLSALAGDLEFFTPFPDDVHISYLPLAHIYERIFSYAFIYGGGSIGYYSGDVLKLKDDIAVLRPTVFASVPRLLTRFYDLINQNFRTQTGIKAKLIKQALEAKLAAAKDQPVYTHSLYDTLVFNKVSKIFGGRIRLIVTASAPISGEILNFLKVALCCQILEAYGQTETTGCGTVTLANDHESGHVGGPAGSISMKLMDIPEMNYFSTNKNERLELAPSGEICFKGPSVMPKYFKNHHATRETIDADRWLHTGDVGLLLPNGSLRIIDRKKNIFKLSQGEYVAPEKLENIFIQSRFVTTIFVHGESLECYLIAIVFPERPVLESHLRSLGFEDTWEDLCNNEKVKKIVLDDLEAIGKAAKLNSFEMVRKIFLSPQVLTPETGLLTPTFKIKRFEMKNHFKETIAHLYQSS